MFSESNKENLAPNQPSEIAAKSSEESDPGKMVEPDEMKMYNVIPIDVELALADKEKSMQLCVEKFLQKIVDVYSILQYKQHNR